MVLQPGTYYKSHPVVGCSIHHITLSSFDDRREVLSVGNALCKFSYKDPFRVVEGEMEEDLAYTLLN